MDRIFLGVVAIYVLWPALTEQPRAFGDAGEYMLMAESLVNHASPDLRPGDVRSFLAAQGQPRLSGVFAPLGRAYLADADGHPYSIHFWAYSLLCVPAKIALRAVRANELRAFQLTNALVFLLALWRLARSGQALGKALAALLVLSPAAAFVLWPHPAAVPCSLVALGLVLWHEGRATCATLLVALGSVQASPLALLAAFFWWKAARCEAKGLGAVRRLGLPTLALLPALAPAAFYLVHFGRPTLLTQVGSVTLASASLKKAGELFFDLNLGMLPYVPVALIGALLVPLAQLAGRRPAASTLALVAVAVASAWACSAADNWNHGTVGPSRYAVWLLPIVLFLFASVLEPEALRERPRRAFGVLAVGALVSQAMIIAGRGGLDPTPDYLRHSYLASFVLRHAPELYRPTPEIFAERTLGYEWHAEDRAAPVVFASHEGCHKALAQKRHLVQLEAACGPLPRPADLKAQAIANRRDEWIYVDYDGPARPGAAAAQKGGSLTP